MDCHSECKDDGVFTVNKINLNALFFFFIFYIDGMKASPNFASNRFSDDFRGSRS